MWGPTGNWDPIGLLTFMGYKKQTTDRQAKYIFSNWIDINKIRRHLTTPKEGGTDYVVELITNKNTNV